MGCFLPVGLGGRGEDRSVTLPVVMTQKSVRVRPLSCPLWRGFPWYQSTLSRRWLFSGSGGTCNVSVVGPAWEKVSRVKTYPFLFAPPCLPACLPAGRPTGPPAPCSLLPAPACPLPPCILPPCLLASLSP